MNQDMKNVLDDFRKMKIMYDIERYTLISIKLNHLIKNYENLIKQREEIQRDYFDIMKDMENNDIEMKIDYERWNRIRSNEKDEWNFELNEITSFKYDIDEALKLLKNGEIEKILIEEEERLTGDKLS